ncbi:glycosyltransferase family 4 protein [Calothrix sp. 336/3]|uniref:glycosyltransferase family 4 protein n=1 Tax=Calothrix sp. 336/3 TaxID=1337936 RepID=UPI0004E3D1A3|nr:glycosyltransferase family 4 protein [Calothrix sp. 336/3]AKG22679.1 glycosyltransferase [Calothrix sp. 336/3]
MRILHILNHVQEIGNGIVNVAVDLACIQANSGHDVAVISGGGEYESLFLDYGVKHYYLDQTRKPINILKAAWSYRQIIQEFQPHIVHAHMMTGIILAKYLQAGYKYHIVSTVHNEFQKSSIFMGLADTVIAVSQAVAESMAKRGIAEKKLRVVVNGTLGSPRTRPVHEYEPANLSHPAIATVAGMYERKGIAELIAAFANIAEQFPQANLYLVGNGPDRQSFETQAQATSVSDRIHFTGFQSEPQHYLVGADIFVLASHKDPCPLVLSEAREAKCAIIATNVDGIPQALEYGKAGILVPPQDSPTLATALTDLLNHPEKLQEWQGKAGENLDWLNVKRVNQETMAIYEGLIAEK